MTPNKLFSYKIPLLLICLSLSFWWACEKDTPTPNLPIIEQNNNNQISRSNDISNQNADCEQRPIVMMHGFLASGDTYALQFQRFTTNNYCIDRLFVFDWNSIAFTLDNTPILDAFIDEVLSQTNATQVDLVGHSAGGGLAYTYLSDPIRSAKVAHYVHLGSNPESSPAGATAEVPTLNIYSTDDTVVPGADIIGATNVMLSGADHYQVATSEATFEAMYSFLNDGTPPETLSISEQEQGVSISGKVLTLGENNPLVGATVAVFEVNPYTGERLNEIPNYTLNSDANGQWGPIELGFCDMYELFVTSANPNDRPIHYYRQGFLHDNSLVYLRTLPPAASIAGLLLGGLPNNDNQSVLAIFTANQAVVNGRDNLYVDDLELSSPTFASADQTTIAFFLYDTGDNTTSGNSVGGLFDSTPFLNGVDVFMPTDTPNFIELQFNGKKMRVRNWKSASEGVIVAVFD